MNEKTILCQVARGDEKSFQELYGHYRNKIFYIAWKLLRSKDKAEDVLQEIFIKIWTHREKLPDIENFNAYLNTLIRNHIYNSLRKQANEEHFIFETLKQDINNSNLTFDTVLLHELQQKLQSAICQLSPQQKRVFRLSRLEGFTHKEIADIMNISKETVKKHMMEASRIVKTHLYSSDKLLLVFIYFCWSLIK